MILFCYINNTDVYEIDNAENLVRNTDLNLERQVSLTTGQY